MQYKIGFIGIGNMGGALLKGILNSPQIDSDLFYIYDHKAHNLEVIKSEFNAVHVCENEKQVAKEADILFIAVKPSHMADVLVDIQKELKRSTIVVSLAAGMSLKQIQRHIGYDQKVIRAMPNTPALVRSGMSALAPNPEIEAEELNAVKQLFDCIGKTELIPESLMHAATAVGGSAPAYVFMFIESLADGAVKAGMPRSQAYQFASQTVLGAAKLIQETQKHPAELKDQVCSPAGTTIAGVQKLEEKGFRAAILEAVQAAVKRSQQLTDE